MATDKPMCEVCGAPATCSVRDIVDVSDPFDNNGSLVYEPDGPMHWFCREHQRESRTRRIEPFSLLMPPYRPR